LKGINTPVNRFREGLNAERTPGNLRNKPPRSCCAEALSLSTTGCNTVKENERLDFWATGVVPRETNPSLYRGGFFILTVRPREVLNHDN
jgi:hypothetical protein